MSITIRNKIESLSDRIDSGVSRSSESTAAFLGRVVNGGSMPSGPERFYLVNPVAIDGAESEGAAGSLAADTDRRIPVVFLGTRQVAIGECFVCRSVGGRWVAESGASRPNCRPKCACCPGKLLEVNATVNDSTSGDRALTYNFTQRAWYSPWLPFQTPYAIQSTGDPCFITLGTGYYFYKFACNTLVSNQVVATMSVPGRICIVDMPAPVQGYYGFGGPAYPGLLGNPWDYPPELLINFTSTGPPSDCDPLTYAATWTGTRPPVASTTFTIPVVSAPAYGEACLTPCPLPLADLTLSWTGPASGSGTLVYDAATKDWKMTCHGRITARLSATGSLTVGFTVTLWDTADCTGTGVSHPFSYPASISLLSYNCSPLDFVFNVAFTSSMLYQAGYRTFHVTE